MTIDQAPAKLFKAFVTLAVAALLHSAGVDSVAHLGPASDGLFANAESALRHLFAPQLLS